MRPGRLGVWAGTNALSGEQLAELAREVERLNYSVLWYPEALAYESLSLGGFLLGRTERLCVASGIANIYARDALTARGGARHAEQPVRRPVHPGVGGVPHPGGGGPARAQVRQAGGHHARLSGGDGRGGGRSGAAGAQRGARGAGSENAGAGAGSGGGGASVLRDAGAHGDGAGDPGARSLALRGAEGLPGPREVAAGQMARYLAMPNYRNHWRRLGFSEEDLAGRGSDRFLDAMVAWGSAGDIRARIDAHFGAGATHVCIQPFDPDGAATPDRRALEALVPA